MDENVIPIVEELRRRLPPANVHEVHGDGRENLSGQHEEAAEEDGMLYKLQFLGSSEFIK